jgi:hypothetical protein
MNQYRQGDVLLIRVAKAPRLARHVKTPAGRIVLAEGETTGHAHRLEAELADLLEDATGRRFVTMELPGRLVHEEHAAIDVPPGVYEVVRQREYVPEQRAVRRVAD